MWKETKKFDIQRNPDDNNQDDERRFFVRTVARFMWVSSRNTGRRGHCSKSYQQKEDPEIVVPKLMRRIDEEEREDDQDDREKVTCSYCHRSRLT